jgi:hypothetical protein
MLKTANYVRAASLEDVQAAGCMAVRVNGHTLALAAHNGTVYGSPAGLVPVREDGAPVAAAGRTSPVRTSVA